jgi:hypothetical protein
MRAPTPSEACGQIAAEHAAGTIAAIHEQRAATLAERLHGYADALAEPGERSPQAGEEGERC